MSGLSRPASLVAERAVRYLLEQARPVDSVRLAAAVLATRAADEATARKILETAFAGDARLSCGAGGWEVSEPRRQPVPQVPPAEPDRVLIFLQGRPGPPGHPFEVHGVSILRLRGEQVVTACGGDAPRGAAGEQLREAVREILANAVVVLHDPPGALPAFERWLGEALETPISLRRLAHLRLGLPAAHDLEALTARLGLIWRASDDPLDHADLLDACLKALRRTGETLDDLRRFSLHGGVRPIDWSRYSFDRAFLRRVPRAPGTYRFYDAEDNLLYVGKSSDLHRRLGSYFREGVARAPRVQELLDRLRRIEYQVTGSELEAILREAEQIRADNPSANVRRNVQEGRGARLRSILILEPAEPPHVLRAYLIHEGRLYGRVGIGPRGGGLAHIERVLNDHFFFAPDGPTTTAGPDLDVEHVVRWLATARDRAVAFDPTTLCSPREVTDRLRWFLEQGSPFDGDGSPIVVR